MGKYTPYIAGFIISLLGLWFYLTPNAGVRHLIEKLDNISYDFQIQTGSLLKKTKDSTIVIVDIDDASLKKEGQWPWQRAKLATLIDKLNSFHPMAILLDVFFSETQPNMANVVLEKLQTQPQFANSCAATLQQSMHLFDEDVLLAESLSRANAVGAEIFLRNNTTLNELKDGLIKLNPREITDLHIPVASGYIANIPPITRAVKGAGFINVEPDPDGIVRRALLVIRYGDEIYPSIALQGLLTIFNNKIVLSSKDYNGKLTLEKLQLGVINIPTDEHGRILIPFAAPGTFKHISATDVLQNKVKEEDLLGKIILIGTSAIGLGDLHATPIGSLVPGVFIQATVIKTIMENNFLNVPAWAYGANFTFICVFGILAALIFPSLGPRTLSLIIIVLPIILFIVNYIVWIKTKFIFSSLLPIMTIIAVAFFNIIYGYIFETRKREKLRDIFGQYVPAKHIDDMINSQDTFRLEGENRKMSVLFADIRNFTGISETIPAQEVVALLNQFFTPMTEIIFKHKGTIDKYVGDMLIAFWNAPLRDKRHVNHAIYSALDMAEEVEILNKEFQERNLPQINIGIGVNTGMMAVGDMGSKFRRNYTVIGDSVNIASRLESLTKFYGVNIIVSEAIEVAVPNVLFGILDKVQIKGKTSSLLIYEAIGLKERANISTLKEVEDFQIAWDLYQKQEWEKSENILSNLTNRFPNKKLYGIYLDRVRQLKENPPAEWDGIYVHADK